MPSSSGGNAHLELDGDGRSVGSISNPAKAADATLLLAECAAELVDQIGGGDLDGIRIRDRTMEDPLHLARFSDPQRDERLGDAAQSLIDALERIGAHGGPITMIAGATGAGSP